MATIRTYIRNNQDFIRERDRHTARPTHSHLPNSHSHLPNNHSQLSRKNNHTMLSHSNARYKVVPISLLKKQSLPPIQESSPKSQLFSLELKRSEELSRYFQSKNQAIVSNRNLRSKTESNEMRQSSSRSHFALNLSQVRMRPLDKYFYRMENIRLAERLLVVKPSPEIRRPNLKEFFKKQRNYSTQLSNNGRQKKKGQKHNKAKLTELEKHWLA